MNSYTADTWRDNDPTKVLSADRMTKLGGQYSAAMADTAALYGSDVRAWAQNTLYPAGRAVVSPAGDMVVAVDTHTSGTTFASTHWTLSGTLFVVDTMFSTLDAALAATPAGGVLEVHQAWTKTLPLSVTKPCTIRFKGGSITQTLDTYAIDIASSNVVIDTPNLIGPGGTVAGSGAGIRAVSVVGAPWTGLRITGGTIDGFRKYGIYLEQVTDFSITDVTVQNVAYAGIMVLSAIRGWICKNKILNVTQPSSFVNSYGIAMTRNSAQDINTAPRSADIVCDSNYVDGVTKWEAIDSHGGQNLTITNNKVRNSFIGIAMVPCPDTSGNDAYAPLHIIIDSNDLDSGKTDGTPRAGIQMVGASYPDPNTVVEYSTGIVTNNIVRNYGTDGSSNNAGVFLQVTRGLVVANNRIINASPNAICVYHNNQGGVIADNVMIDTWSTLGSFTSCVYVSSSHNKMSVFGNRAVTTGTKSATKVNDRGFFVASAITDNTDVNVNYANNDFTVCTSPLVDSTVNQNITFERHDARRFGVFGATPVTKPTVTGSRGSNAALASALTALAALGLIVDSTTT